VPGGASLILMMDAATSRVVLLPPIPVGTDAAGAARAFRRVLQVDILEASGSVARLETRLDCRKGGMV
jgi:hypothetical protein